jgi:hypothetical protein
MIRPANRGWHCQPGPVCPARLLQVGGCGLSSQGARRRRRRLVL